MEFFRKLSAGVSAMALIAATAPAQFPPRVQSPLPSSMCC